MRSRPDTPDSDAPLPPFEERPVVLEFPDADQHSELAQRPAPSDAGAQARWLSYVLPAALLAGACLPLVFIVRRPVGLFGWVLGAAFTIVLLWVVVSTLWPSKPDRTCPECGAKRLRRLDPNSTLGLACGACGWSDPDESSWMFAEEEGPLEKVVLRQRGRSPALPNRESPSVDKGRSTD